MHLKDYLGTKKVNVQVILFFDRSLRTSNLFIWDVEDDELNIFWVYV